jgi:UDP-N-acetylmuramate--alanine ligase
MTTKKSSPRTPRRAVHFVGIGGIGMSALARYFLSQNWAVSGSDAAAGTITQSLIKDGVKAKIGHKKAYLPPSTELVVTTQAINNKNNPEVQEALRRGMRVLTYPEAVGELTRRYKTVAIAGSHGKSTTTALSALTLIKAGLDPTVIVGTNLKEFGGKNFRAGKSELLVLEADEFGRAFYHYFPLVAIVTNIDREHLDVYKNIADAKSAFLRFLGNTVDGGALILNRDDKNLYSLKKDVTALAKRKHLVVAWYSLKDRSAAKIKKTLKIFGEHNISNAAAVYQLGKLLKISEKDIFAALGAYGGAWRRMEYRGTAKIKNIKEPALVYDDYAHHPTEIKATLAAFKKQFPERPLVCVFQPHQGKRLELLFREFTTAFDFADAVILLPLYKVRGRDEKFARDSLDLARAAQQRMAKKQVVYLENPSKLQVAVNDLLISRSPLIVMMGAGDIVDHTQKLLSLR